MSPHLYPEYIIDLAYYYGAAPRPGFMGRFLVGEEGVRGPYWPTSATNFGGQIAASNNGDMPATPYRLLGGIALRLKDQVPLCGGYVASAFILPKGTNNNRVIAAGSEEIMGTDGQKSRFFVVAPRPGMVYEQGATFVPAFQIDPIVPAHLRCVLRFPDGTEKVAEGTADRLGSFAATPGWALDQAGLYVYTVQSDWEGFPGHVPGLPEEGGYVYVLEREHPAGARGLKLAMKGQQSFAVEEGLTVEGFSNAETVYYAADTPGAVVDQGALPVDSGQFLYRFDPAAANQRIPVYDIVNRRNGRKEIGRVIHLTFFARQRSANGTPYHAFARVILRGTTAIYTT